MNDDSKQFLLTPEMTKEEMKAKIEEFNKKQQEKGE